MDGFERFLWFLSITNNIGGTVTWGTVGIAVGFRLTIEFADDVV
jgi:hypothetical protein